MSSMFYRAFEERYRGSRDLIISRLSVYLPFIEPLKAIHNQPQALDVGCGRGEWLELLQQHDFKAKGVSLDEGMLLACKELNFDVIQYDAIDYIKSLPSESLSVISAFHFIEHISFERLCQLVEAAYRVLKPGGLLIMETPNSENLLVGTSSFYLDPTHQRPVPASLLSFLVEYAKFGRVKTIFLQEQLDTLEKQEISLRSVFENVSPDYGVIAQKKAEPAVYRLFDAPFTREYGTRLLTLAEHYDKQLKTHIQWCHTELAKVEKLIFTLNITNQRNIQLNSQIQILQNELEIVNKQKITKPNYAVHYWWATADVFNKQIQAIYSSTSWRVTAPLRKIGRILKNLPKLPIYSIRVAHRLLALLKQIAPLTLRLMRMLLLKAELKKWVSHKLTQYPYLKSRLRQMTIRLGLMDRLPFNYQIVFNSEENNALPTRDNLSSRGVDIYQDLKKAIKRKGRGKK